MALAYVEARALEPDELGHAQPARIQPLQHRAVAARNDVVTFDRADQAFDVVRPELPGDLARAARSADVAQRILLDHALAQQELEESAHGGRHARLRGRS